MALRNRELHARNDEDVCYDVCNFVIMFVCWEHYEKTVTGVIMKLSVLYLFFSSVFTLIQPLAAI